MGYVQWLLYRIERDDICLIKSYEHYKELVDSEYELHERPLSNIAMVLVGVSLFNELAKELRIDCVIDQQVLIEEQVNHFNGNKIHNIM